MELEFEIFFNVKRYHRVENDLKERSGTRLSVA